MITPPAPDPHGESSTRRGDAEVAEYLTRRPALVSVLQTAAKRYRTNNGLRGEIHLRALAEREAVQALGAHLRGRKRDKVAIEELDRAFRMETRFAMPLTEVLRVLLGAAVFTREERQAALAAARSTHEDRLRVAGSEGAAMCAGDPDAGRAAVEAWLAVDSEYIRTYAPAPFDEPTIAEESIPRASELVARALGAIRVLRDPIAVPVLAQIVAGQPHALDTDTSGGRLLDRALALTTPEAGIKYPLADAEERDLLYSAAGLVVDELSSAVSAYHLLGDAPLLVGARAQNCVLTFPLATVRGLGPVSAAHEMVYAVENPAVFMGLVQAVRERPLAERPTLVCTSGQLSVAARRLLDLLVRDGARVRYGGDFDVMGLTIAHGLRTRWPDAVELWRMSAADYDAARWPGDVHAAGAAIISRERVESLLPAFPELVPRLVKNGPAYQEALLGALVADITEDMQLRSPERAVGGASR